MPKSKKNTHLIFLTAFCDALAIAASFLLSYLLRFAPGLIPYVGVAPEFNHYVQPLIVVVPLSLWIFRAYGLYQTQRHIRRIEEIFLVVKAITFAVLSLMALTFFYRNFMYSRIYLIITWMLSIVLVSGMRYLLIQWEYQRKVQRKELTRVLVVGANRHARSVIQWAKGNAHYGHEIIGVLAKNPSLVGKHLEGATILGVTEQCESFIKNLKPDRVVVVDPSFPRQKTTDLILVCEDEMIDFKIAADFYGLMSQSVDVEYISRVPLLGFRQVPLDDFGNRMIKRAFDIVVTLALCILTLPVWLAVIAAIKLDDKGPIFYFQERMGRDGRLFKLIKFRTMRVDAEKNTGPVWARPNDDRRTRIGNFLRMLNLDELPQLLNVLQGEMSLVGPRPERPHFVNQFRESIPRYMARHKIRSGITGWAQVNGYRGNTSIHERLKYDLYYMENWSLLFDLEILLMTLFAYKNAY